MRQTYMHTNTQRTTSEGKRRLKSKASERKEGIFQDDDNVLVCSANKIMETKVSIFGYVSNTKGPRRLMER